MRLKKRRSNALSKSSCQRAPELRLFSGRSTEEVLAKCSYEDLPIFTQAAVERAFARWIISTRERETYLHYTSCDFVPTLKQASYRDWIAKKLLSYFLPEAIADRPDVAPPLKSKPAQNFLPWLRAQRHRTDDIGYLARSLRFYPEVTNLGQLERLTFGYVHSKVGDATWHEFVAQLDYVLERDE
jgi:hypothetical protein